jgi:hypothetical protein
MNRHSRASSLTSLSTTSSTWGPGALAGKALEALGVENLVIRRKLASFRSVFPHDNDTMIRDIEQVYDDLLELTR